MQTKLNEKGLKRGSYYTYSVSMLGGDQGAHLVDVECVFSGELVVSALDELELVQRNADHLQHF